jgi:hypothetical protein
MWLLRHRESVRVSKRPRWREEEQPSQAKVLTEGGDLRVTALLGFGTDTFNLTRDMLALTEWSQAEGLD